MIHPLHAQYKDRVMLCFILDFFKKLIKKWLFANFIPKGWEAERSWE